jgi:hypothetical protein
MFKEIWKDIQGYEGIYQVSNLGNVKSLARKVKCKNNMMMPVKEKILNKFTTKKMYHRVTLGMNQNKDGRSVHRLVMCAFKGFSNLQVNHINGNKLDNSLNNLEYVTALQNCNHRELIVKGKEKYGTTYSKIEKRWTSQIVTEGKCVKLGRSNNLEDAQDLFYLAYCTCHGVAPW